MVFSLIGYTYRYILAIKWWISDFWYFPVAQILNLLPFIVSFVSTANCQAQDKG
jgi:hypothetical protein